MKIDYVEVGKRIREFREKLDLTQEDLAFAIGTSAAYVSEMERAVKKPSLDKLYEMGEVLGVTVNDFIYPATINDSIIAGLKSGFLKRISRYSLDEQSILLDNLDSIVNIVSTK
jgi:transcriptional regulator with XRE-family HTH domain